MRLKVGMVYAIGKGQGKKKISEKGTTLAKTVRRSSTAST